VAVRPRSGRRRGGAGLILLAVLAGLLLAADVIAKRAAADELADRLRTEVPEAGSTSAAIHSFPFVPRLLTSGRVAEVDAGVRDLTVEGLRFASIAVKLHGVELDKSRLLDQRRVVLQRIDRGEVRAEVTQEAITDLVGIPVSLEQGRASVQFGGRQIGADLAVREGRLILGASGVSLPALPLPTVPLLPCVANAEIAPGRVLLTCQFTEVPQELLVEAQTEL
jgi:hypothetical protein